MLAKLYRMLWSRIGGRPWTYIIREWYHANPILVILGLGGLATWIGVILGHLFW